MKLIAVVVGVALCAGCATRGTQFVPIIDMQGKDPTQAQRDLDECQAYARSSMDAATGAAIGGIATALIGALITPRGYRNDVATKAGALGALGGAGRAVETQETIIRRCMSGRGYSVLN